MTTVHRKAYTRKDGTRVKATTYKQKSKNSGKSSGKKKWFAAAKGKKSTGWKKSQSAETRRQKLLAATDKRRSLHNRYVEAGRNIQMLANVTTDPETKTKATSDAQYFFLRAKKT